MDALFGVDVEPEEGELEVEIKEHNAALVVDGGKEKMVGEGFGGEEVPTGRGDQRREVMKGVVKEGGGGMRKERKCMERVSMMEMELSKGNAMRP